MSGVEPETMYDEPPAYADAASNERTWALFAHLSALVGYSVIPFGNIIGPLIVWLVKKDEMPFVNDQGKEAVNFQISVTIYFVIACLSLIVLIGLVLAPAVFLFGLVMTIVAAVKANNGEPYRYPLTIRFIN